jgi:hypothetical protein
MCLEYFAVILESALRVGHTVIREHARITVAVASGETFHHPIDFLRFAGQSKRP